MSGNPSTGLQEQNLVITLLIGCEFASDICDALTDVDQIQLKYILEENNQPPI